MSPHNGITPFYFGLPDKPLFGCYHKPRAGRDRQCAAVICQPMGHEYINCHRALRHLASRLADAGFPVLRFDYYGCGDSAGEPADGGIARWMKDISAAISEIKTWTSLSDVCVIGVRLGAALATLTAVQNGGFESLVLWDPVVEGRGYLQELLSLQKEMLRFRPKPIRRKCPSGFIEVLGFPLSNDLCSELEKINLLQISKKPARNVLIIRSCQSGDEGALEGHLNQSEASTTGDLLDIPKVWLPTVDGSLLVPNKALQSVVSWVSRIHA